MTFQEQLILSLFDKLLIGGLIVLIGFAANTILEKIKSNLSLQNEFTKQRLVYIGDVWSSLYAWDDAVQSLINSTAKIQSDLQSHSKELMDMESHSKELMDQAIKRAKANRFWLGQEYYNLIEFQNALVDYMNAFAERDLKGMKKAESKRDEAKRVFSDFLK